MNNTTLLIISQLSPKLKSLWEKYVNSRSKLRLDTEYQLNWEKLETAGPGELIN